LDRPPVDLSLILDFYRAIPKPSALLQADSRDRQRSPRPMVKQDRTCWETQPAGGVSWLRKRRTDETFRLSFRMEYRFVGTGGAWRDVDHSICGSIGLLFEVIAFQHRKQALCASTLDGFIP
jgi:hypothetical protein